MGLGSIHPSAPASFTSSESFYDDSFITETPHKSTQRLISTPPPTLPAISKKRAKSIGLCLSAAATNIRTQGHAGRRWCRFLFRSWQVEFRASALLQVNEVFDRFEELTLIRHGLPHLAHMFSKIAINDLRPAFVVNASLSEMTLGDWDHVGRSFSSSLVSNTDIKSAVDDFILKFPALQQLDAEHTFFRPCLTVLGQSLLKEAAWGAKARLYIGAGLAMLDVGTDLNMIFVFLGAIETAWHGQSMIWMLCSCMLIQLLLVVMQNRKAPWGEIFREVLIVFSQCKPAVDAHRVACGKQCEKHHLIEPKMEYVVVRVIEMFFEAIPGCIIGCMAYLAKPSYAALFSLMVSAATTGFTSSLVSFDFDVDPENRKNKPAFYGYMPDDALNRALTFCCMWGMSSLFLLFRSFGAAMLLSVNKWYFVLEIVGNLTLFFVMKAIVCDVWHWLPVEGALGASLTFLIRTIVKIVVDFTGLVHLRISGEMGGAFWTFNMLLGPVVAFVSMLVYYANTAPAAVVLEQKTCALVMVGMVAALLINFGLFLKLMKSEYRGSFFSLETGVQGCQACFLNESNSDEVRLYITNFNRRMWQSILPQVKNFIVGNWERWEREEPDWFTEDFKARLDRDLLPKHELQRQIKLAGGSARRPSIFKKMGGTQQKIRVVPDVEEELPV